MTRTKDINLDKPPLYGISPPSSGTGLWKMTVWGREAGYRAVYDVGVGSSSGASLMGCTGAVFMSLVILGLCHIVIFMRHITWNYVTKTDSFGASYQIYISIFLTPLQIFVSCLEMIFFINHYFYYVYLSTIPVRALILVKKFRGTVLFKQSPQQYHKKDNNSNKNSRG